MKHLRKLASLLLAMVMIFSLATTAFADEATKNDSITVNNAKPGETYKLYKLFDLDVDNEIDPKQYSYTINRGWADFFAEDGDGHAHITMDGEYVTDVEAEALAKAAANWEGKPAATDTVVVAEGETAAVFEGLDDGYWLITSTLGTVAMTETTPDKSAVSFNEKNHENTIIKEVKEDSTGTYGEKNDAQIGDPVEFKSTVKIVKGTRNVIVHDKMDSGLTYTTGSVAIKGLTKGTEYTVVESATDGDTFDITFDQNWIDNLDFGDTGYKEYVITYTAVLNENAVEKDENGVVIVDQKNETYVSFGDKSKSQEDTTETTTHKFSIFKHASGSTENLAGAVFQLKKGDVIVKLIKLDDNNYRVAKSNENSAVGTFTTVKNGDIVIWGVDADNDYTLTETEAPEGYNKLSAAVNVTVNAENGTRIGVENNAGSELPSTGGMGTTLFYALGGILVVAAVVLLVTKKRMSSAE